MTLSSKRKWNLSDWKYIGVQLVIITLATGIMLSVIYSMSYYDESKVAMSEDVFSATAVGSELVDVAGSTAGVLTDDRTSDWHPVWQIILILGGQMIQRWWADNSKSEDK